MAILRTFIPPQNLKAITSYVKASVVSVKNGRKCVDGRYLPEQATGMIARPGGDGGYVMALMAVNDKKKLGLTPEHCFNAIYKIVSEDGGFCMHTDQTTDPDSVTHQGLIGCGHLAKAASKQFCRDYDVHSDDVEKVIKYARNIHEISSAISMVRLQGEHKEQGVLIINSTDYTVLADNPKLSQMYFIYDEERDTAFMKHIVKKLAIPEVTYEDLKRESDLQLQATLQILARNLPIFSVTFTGATPVVSHVGNVEPKVPSSRISRIRNIRFPSLQRFTHRFTQN